MRKNYSGIKRLLILFIALYLSVPSFFPITDRAFADDFHFNFPNSDILNVNLPPLGERLTVEGNTATLFAPYVTPASGWYDVNKRYDPNDYDGNLCWAASCSNIIAWYLDVCEKTGVADVSTCERDPDAIFQKFKDNFKKEGYDPLQGMCWYFAGNFTGGGYPDNLINHNSGGYLKFLPFCGDDWYTVDPQTPYFGSYADKHPFIENLTGSYGLEAPLSTHRKFSENIIRQLKYGATSLMVSRQGASALGSHAVTLWGCDFDINTGLITKIYITDSDDEQEFVVGPALKPVKIKARRPDRDGIEMVGYWLDDDRFTNIADSMLMFSPDVIKRENRYENNIHLSVDSAITPDNINFDIHSDVAVQWGVLFVATYDKKGFLTGVYKKSTDGNSSFTVNFPKDNKSAYAKVMIFDYADSITPLCLSQTEPIIR